MIINDYVDEFETKSKQLSQTELSTLAKIILFRFDAIPCERLVEMKRRLKDFDASKKEWK